MKSYKLKKYEQALIEAYIKFDEILKMEKVNHLLIKQYNNIQSGNKYEINIEFKFDNNSENRIMEVISNNSPGRSGYLKNNINTNEKNPEILSIKKKEANTLQEKNLSKKDKQRTQDLEKNDKENQSSSPLPNSSNKVEDSSLKYSANNISAENYSSLISNDMGTTANILLIKNNMLYLANVGDSMAVLFKNGQAIRLNHEHKTTLQSEFTRVTKSGAKIINNRIEGRLNLTRAIGIFII